MVFAVFYCSDLIVGTPRQTHRVRLAFSVQIYSTPIEAWLDQRVHHMFMKPCLRHLTEMAHLATSDIHVAREPHVTTASASQWAIYLGRWQYGERT